MKKSEASGSSTSTKQTNTSKPKRNISKVVKVEEPIDSKKRPTSSEMVELAVTALHNKKGFSFQAILKYITVNFDCNEETMKRLHSRIKKNFLERVENGQLNQLSGQGVNGSFKLSSKKLKKETNLERVENGQLHQQGQGVSGSLKLSSKKPEKKENK